MSIGLHQVFCPGNWERAEKVSRSTLRVAPAATAFGCNGRPRGLSSVESFFDPPGDHGELEDSRADRVIDRVGDHRTHRHNRRFAPSLGGSILVIQDVRLYFREPGEPGD